MIVYVGGNKDGNDGKYFMTLCPKCKIHIFEPVPTFFRKLKSTWDGFVADKGWNVVTHQLGLGNGDRFCRKHISCAFETLPCLELSSSDKKI